MKKNNKILFLHIDGLIVDRIPEFIRMGVDVLNPIEPCGGAQDIFELKKQFGGKIAFCGNIDINGVLLNGTSEQIRTDVIKHITALAVRGGYIAASSHDIHQHIPLENFFAMRDAVHAYTFSENIEAHF